jgi:hypothetical protein
MRKVWAIIALVAALSLPSFAAAMVLPPAEDGAVYVVKKKAPECKPASPGLPSPCAPGSL